jgi:hypothetical protein
METMNQNKVQRREDKKLHRMMKAKFPKVEVVWGDHSEGEVCGLGTAAMKVGKSIAEIFHNLEFGEGEWKTTRFTIRMPKKS